MSAEVQASGIAAAASRATAREREQRFFAVIGLMAILLVLGGFARTYFLRAAFDSPALSPLVHAHGALFTSWVLLFIVQTRLVAKRRIDWHRRLGIFGGMLALLMVIVAWAVVFVATGRDFRAGRTTDPLSFMAIALGDLVLFGVFVGAALWFRRNAAAHKRFMLLATIALLPAAVGRLPVLVTLSFTPTFAATDLLIAACMLVDLFAWKRVHPVFLYGGLAFVLSQPARMIIGKTEMWLTFSRWLIS